jgi:glutaredoxin 3
MSPVIVYSKPNCPYCVKAKHLLEMRKIPYVERVVGEDVTREELLEAAPNARTVPQIIINQKSIGGYDQLVTYIDETGFNATGFTL